MNTINTLLQKIESAKELDFGTIFSKSIELFKKVWLQGLVSYLLNMLLMIPVMLVIYVPLIFLGLFSSESFNNEGTSFSELDSLQVLTIILTIALAVIVIIVIMAVSLALKAAFFRIIKNKDLGHNESDDYFFFLKKKYLKKTLGLSLVILGIVILAYILCVLPILYAIVPLYFIIVAFAMNPDMPNSDIVKAGFKLGNKKWLITFGLLFVAWLLSTVVGLLMCFIGLYVTQQFIDIPVYQVYKESIGFNETSPIEEIGTPVE